MTIICGILRNNNGLDCRKGLELMMQPIAGRRAENLSSWGDNQIALGQYFTINTPECINEHFPIRQDNLTIIGDIRLDNRAELLLQLGIEGRNDISDGRLILYAYKRWGEVCPEHLLGDFCFALWDAEAQKLFCSSDHFGIKTLFYYSDGQTYIFASTPTYILAAPNVITSLNYNKLATLIFPDTKHLFWDESWFENIFPLAAATTLTIDKNGLKKRKYWSPEIGKELSFKNEDEYAEAFQEIMFRSVADRLRSPAPITALLSGGLDSSSVVSVAAKILEKQNRELQVFSAVLPDENDPVLTDERYFIDQFNSMPNVKINYVTAAGKGFFSGIEALKTTIHGPNLISRHFLYTEFAEKAESMGSKVLLDGLGGELGATFHGTGAYSELFYNMRWLQLWKEIKARKTLLGEPLQYNLLNEVIRPFLPNQAVNFLRKKHTGLAKTRPHCIQDGLTERLKERLQTRNNELESIVNNNKVSVFHRQNQLNMLLTKQNKSQGAADLGPVEIRHPLMDKRLLEFCLATPIDFKIKNGFKRYTVRVGLNNILPSEIQWRNSKGAFSPDYNRRYKEQLFLAQQFLESISLNDPVRNIVDIEKLKMLSKVSLTDEEFGTFAEKTARDYVPQGIYLIQFLRRFTEFQI